MPLISGFVVSARYSKATQQLDGVVTVHAEAGGACRIQLPPAGHYATVTVTEQATGKVLGFCRSGARSMLGWALARSEDLPADELIALARGAGHDLSRWRSVFDARYAAHG